MKFVTCTGAFILMRRIESRFASFSLLKKVEDFFSTLIAKPCCTRFYIILLPTTPSGVALELIFSGSSSMRAVVAGILSLLDLYIPLAKDPRSTEWALPLPASLALIAIGAARFCIIDCETNGLPRFSFATKVESLFYICWGVFVVSFIDWRWRCKKKVFEAPWIYGSIFD